MNSPATLQPEPRPTDPGAQQRTPTLTATQAAAVDDPPQFESFTRWLDTAESAGPTAGRVAQSRLLLSGLHCAACAGIIESALLQVPGVRDAQVQGASQRAQVSWDAAVTKPSLLIEAVRRAGYDAFPDTGAQATLRHARDERRALWQLFVAGFCMMQVMMVAVPVYLAAPGEIAPDVLRLLHWAGWVMSLPVLLFSAAPFFSGAWRSLRQRRIGMDVPVALGIAVTFVASSAAAFDPGGRFGHEVYFDSLTMFVCLLLLARALELRARSRAAQALDAVMRRLPDAVERLDEHARGQWVSATMLRRGDFVRVHAGQAFPADGVLTAGGTDTDESLLTGESQPVPRGAGDAVSAGCLNLSAPVVMRVEQVGPNTRYQRIVALVERALTERPAFLRSIDRLAGPFLWTVLALAAAAAAAWSVIDPPRAVWVAVAVLIVTCPCALSLAAPVALLASAGELARRGVLVQRLDAIEALARVDTVVFDKTGTLTEDRLTMAHMTVLPQAVAPCERLAALAASLAARSHHPLAQAIAAAHRPDPTSVEWHNAKEHAGQGIEGTLDDAPWRLGRAPWAGAGDDAPARPAVWLATRVQGRWQAQARFEFDETLRADAREAVQSLQRDGLHTRLLSGDAAPSVQALASRLGVADALAAATPQDKLDAVQALQAGGHCIAMVGDGINDAPVLARSDVSIAMGSAAALAQSRADMVVLSNRLSEVPRAVALARRTMRIVRQNLGWAVVYNAACVPLALAGWLPPWLAGIGMAASSLLVVLNALRLLRGAGETRRDAALRSVNVQTRTA